MSDTIHIAELDYYDGTPDQEGAYLVRCADGTYDDALWRDNAWWYLDFTGSTPMPNVVAWRPYSWPAGKRLQREAE